MPALLILIAAIIGIVAYRGTHREFGALIASDFSGSQNFASWLVALFVVGAIGYIPGMDKIAGRLLLLLIVVLVLVNGGLFDKFLAALQQLQSRGAAGSQITGSSSGETTTNPLSFLNKIIDSGNFSSTVQTPIRTV